MRTANAILSSLDGKEERSFGNTCCNNPSQPPRNCSSPAAVPSTTGSSMQGLNFNSLGHFSGDGCDFDHLRLEIPTPPQAAGSST